VINEIFNDTTHRAVSLRQLSFLYFFSSYVESIPAFLVIVRRRSTSFLGCLLGMRPIRIKPIRATASAYVCARSNCGALHIGVQHYGVAVST